MGSRNQPGEVEERDFPVGPVVKNSSSNAVDTGSMPSRGTKIPPYPKRASETCL